MPTNSMCNDPYIKKENEILTNKALNSLKKGSIFTITPYKLHYEGGYAWVFDDGAVGLHQEALIAGADVMCDIFSAGREKFGLQFAAIPFPTHEFVLDYVSGKIEEGTFYSFGGESIWLCPALGCYFAESPKNLYIKPL